MCDMLRASTASRLDMYLGTWVVVGLCEGTTKGEHCIKCLHQRWGLSLQCYACLLAFALLALKGYVMVAEEVSRGSV